MGHITSILSRILKLCTSVLLDTRNKIIRGVIWLCAYFTLICIIMQIRSLVWFLNVNNLFINDWILYTWLIHDQWDMSSMTIATSIYLISINMQIRAKKWKMKNPSDKKILYTSKNSCAKFQNSTQKWSGGLFLVP